MVDTQTTSDVACEAPRDFLPLSPAIGKHASLRSWPIASHHDKNDDERQPARRREVVNAPLIVVGVDGSPASVAALRWAIGEASATGRRVKAVHAWRYLPEPTSILLTPPRASRDDEERWARTLLDDAVQEALNGQEVQPPVAEQVVEGDAARALLEAAQGADLLVVGARRHGIVRGALFGSVSQHCARHATCPIVVVPPAPDAEREERPQPRRE